QKAAMAGRLGVQTHRSEVSTLRPSRRSAAKLLTKDEARRIAAGQAAGVRQPKDDRLIRLSCSEMSLSSSPRAYRAVLRDGGVHERRWASSTMTRSHRTCRRPGSISFRFAKSNEVTIWGRSSH